MQYFDGHIVYSHPEGRDPVLGLILSDTALRCIYPSPKHPREVRLGIFMFTRQDTLGTATLVAATDSTELYDVELDMLDVIDTLSREYDIRVTPIFPEQHRRLLAA